MSQRTSYDWLKTLLPILLAIAGAYVTLEHRLASIEKSLAVTETRLDFYFGRTGHGRPAEGTP